MTQRAFPFDAGPGASITEADWGKMARLWRPSGVVRGETNELVVTANGSGMQVFADTGIAWNRGFFYENDASITVPIDASSPSQGRIDRIVVRLDTTLNTILVAVIKGTPSGTPVAPAMQAGPVLWDIPLALVAVDAAVVNIAGGKVTDDRLWADFDAGTLDGHDSTYFLAAAALTKAAIDALNVDADTLDGHDTSYFLAAAALDKAAIDALNVDADTLDGIDSTGLVQCPGTQVLTKRITAVSAFDASGNAVVAHGLTASKILWATAQWFYNGDNLWRFATVTSWDATNLNISAGTANANGRNAAIVIIHDA